MGKKSTQISETGLLRDSRPCNDKSILKIWNENLTNIVKWKYPIQIKKIDPVLYYVDKLTPFYALTIQLPDELKHTLDLNYDFRIYYSKQIEYTYKDTKMLALKNFLMHELIHTIPGCFNHGKNWKKYIIDLNEKHGFRINPKPYSSKEHFGLF